MVLGYRFLRPFGSKRQSRAIDSFLYCKGTKINNAKQEFSGFISDLFQMLKLRGGLKEEMSKNRQELYPEIDGYLRNELY